MKYLQDSPYVINLQRRTASFDSVLSLRHTRGKTVTCFPRLLPACGKTLGKKEKKKARSDTAWNAEIIIAERELKMNRRAFQVRFHGEEIGRLCLADSQLVESAFASVAQKAGKYSRCVSMDCLRPLCCVHSTGSVGQKGHDRATMVFFSFVSLLPYRQILFLFSFFFFLFSRVERKSANM